MKTIAPLLLLIAAWGGPLVAQGAPRVLLIPLVGDSIFPEGIAGNQLTGELFVGSAGRGGIQRIADGRAEWFVPPGERGLRAVVGLATDESRHRLLAVSQTFLVNGQFNSDPRDLPEIIAFDTESHALIGRWEVPFDGAPHFLNDIAVDRSGTAYITDSFSPTIWRLTPGAGALERFVEHGAFQPQAGFNLNGIVVTPDGSALIASIPGRNAAFFRIDLATREVSRVAVTGSHAGGDGLVFVTANRMLAVLNGLTVIQFNTDFSSATAAALTGSWGNSLDFPTTAAVAGNRLWVVNSQLDHYVPFFGVDQPHREPFTVAGIDLKDLVAPN